MTLPIPFRAASILPGLAVQHLHQTTASTLCKPPGGRERPPYNARQTGGITGGRWMTVVECPPCVGADACIGPPQGLAIGCRFRAAAHSQPQCRAGVHARRLRFPAPQGLPGEMPAWLRHVPIVTRTPPPAPQPLPKNPLSICATLQFLPSRPFLPSGRLTFSS